MFGVMLIYILMLLLIYFQELNDVIPPSPKVRFNIILMNFM